MIKKQLLQVLSSLPDNTPITATFCFGRNYDSEHNSAITSISVIEDKDETLTAVICAKEVTESDPSMGKGTIETILAIIPDEAKVVARYTFVNKYNVTYECYIEGISLNLDKEQRLTATLRLYEKPDKKAA